MERKCANLCNESVLTFGSNLCRKENETLPMSGGAANGIGYVVPDKVIIREFSASWKQDSCGKYNEKIQIISDGQVLFEADITSDDGVDRIYASGLSIPVAAGQGITVKSIAIDKETCWEQTCELEVTVWVEKHCDVEPEEEGDGIFEVYLSDTGVIELPDVWSIVNMDIVRVNTIPTYVSWDGTKATIQPGIYKVDYNTSIETSTSTSLNFRGKLVVDGVDYVSSQSGSYIIAGMGGAVSLSKSVVLVVEDEIELTFQAKVDTDSSSNAAANANLIIQRIDKGTKIPVCDQ